MYLFANIVSVINGMNMNPQQIIGFSIHNLLQSIDELEANFANHPIDIKEEESFIEEQSKRLNKLSKDIVEWPPSDRKGSNKTGATAT
jgi:hypothetical protein